MASKSNITHLADQVETKLDTILLRATSTVSGSPASDRAAELLRELSAALDAFDQQSIGIVTR